MRNQLTEICDSLGIVANKESSQHNVDQVSIIEIQSEPFHFARASTLHSLLLLFPICRSGSSHILCNINFHFSSLPAFHSGLTTTTSNTTTKIRKCLITGLFNNIAELHQRDNHYVVLSNRQRAKIHPSSVLSGYHANLNGFSSTNGNGTAGSKMKDGNNQRPVYVMFSEIVQTTQIYLRTVTRIEPEWIEEVVPECGYSNRINNNQL